MAKENTGFSVDIIKAELSRRLSGFEFEEGAVLVQIPQVPLNLIERKMARNRGYFAYPPQGLLYLSAIFRELGISTRIIDLNYVVLTEAQEKNPNIEKVWQDSLDKELAVFKNPFVCVSFMFSTTYLYFKKACEHIRRKKPGTCIAAGGVNAMAEEERILNEKLADFVFSHDGESSLRNFYAYLRGNSEALPLNIAFLGRHNSITRTPKLPGADIDIDIRNEYSKIPIRDFHKAGSLSNYSRMSGTDVPFAVILSRRGCRGHCAFCGVRSFYGKGVRVRKVEGVIQEMELLYQKYGIRHFDWVDDDLLFDANRALEMFNQMAIRLPGISWAVNNGLVVAAITPDIMRAMEKSGCIGFKVGLESGNESILQKIRKPITLEKFFSFANLSQEFPSMFVAVNLILGLPGENLGQMLDSFKVALRAKLDWYNFYMYQPIKNTELYSLFQRDELIVANRQGKKERLYSLNPVRGGEFKDYRLREDMPSGYEIINMKPELVPNREQLKEIWFTFNFIVNFLRLPALFTQSEIRIRNASRWMTVLSQAYPADASMSCVLYYLRRRLGIDNRRSLERLKKSAASKIKRSKYWQFRDKQFNFYSFLEGIVPEVPLEERFLS